MRNVIKRKRLLKHELVVSDKVIRLLTSENKKKHANKKIERSSVVIIPRSYRRRKDSKSNKKVIFFTNRKNLISKGELIRKHLPTNLNYLIANIKSPFYLKAISKEKLTANGRIEIPEDFSILDNPNESYYTLKKIVSALLIESASTLILDYKKCLKVELSTQVLLDIILKDFWVFRTKCQSITRNNVDYFPSTIGGENINNEDVRKLLFSVGSPTILKVREIKYNDIIPYKLCIHDNEKERDLERRIEQKEIDTTIMADYVLSCLKRMNKKMTREKLNDLCTVIGEILINAEEHSSTKFRFSIGYFIEANGGSSHSGIFRLVILNFGETIYEKFKSPDCPNKDIVIRMNKLSNSYTSRGLFSSKKFEEENLWTLYALQEGVTSIPYIQYKRGNGSIRFIESFFNIKGSQEADSISRMSIVSGNTRIVFDGRYNISQKLNELGETFKVMTFNDSGSIENLPDENYVFCMKEYFPGTVISARILLNDDDLKEIINK